MINCSQFSNNQKLAKLIAEMNRVCNYHADYYDKNITFQRPTEDRGYFPLLKAAIQLGQFTWKQLLLNCDMTDDIINGYALKLAKLREVYNNTEDDETKECYANLIENSTFTKYAHSYLNFYRSFFKRHGIMEQVPGNAQHNAYRVTSLGVELFKALKTQIQNNLKANDNQVEVKVIIVA